MGLQLMLKCGNPVRLKCDSGYYMSTIDEIISDDCITILEPWDEGRRLKAKVGEIYGVSCITEKGIYTFEGVVSNADYSDNVAVIEIQCMGDCKRIQRREAFRVKVGLDVRIRRLTDDDPEAWQKTKSIDLSETGVLVPFQGQCIEGDMMELVIDIKCFGLCETLPLVHGRITRRVFAGRKGSNQLLGLRFEGMPEKAQNTIMKVVALSQRMAKRQSN